MTCRHDEGYVNLVRLTPIQIFMIHSENQQKSKLTPEEVIKTLPARYSAQRLYIKSSTAKTIVKKVDHARHLFAIIGF